MNNPEGRRMSNVRIFLTRAIGDTWSDQRPVLVTKDERDANIYFDHLLDFSDHEGFVTLEYPTAVRRSSPSLRTRRPSRRRTSPREKGSMASVLPH